MVADLGVYLWSQGDLNPRPLACHLSAQSSARFIAVQNRPLTWTDAGVLVHGCSYPFESVAALVAAIAVSPLLVLFRFRQSRRYHKPKWDVLEAVGLLWDTQECRCSRVVHPFRRRVVGVQLASRSSSCSAARRIQLERERSSL